MGRADRIGRGSRRRALTDAEIVARSLERPEAFGTLFERHGDAVFGYFARRVPRAEVADLVADTFVLAFDRRESFDLRRRRARPWLYGVATNVLRHHLRRTRREQGALLRLTPRPADTGPEDDVGAALAAADEWAAVLDALDHLAEIDRDAVLLVAWDGLSYAEVAEAADVPVGTVRSRVNRARRQLRERVPRSGQHPVATPPNEEANDHG